MPVAITNAKHPGCSVAKLCVTAESWIACEALATGSDRKPITPEKLSRNAALFLKRPLPA